MIAKILISPSQEARITESQKILASHLEGVNLNSHPDVLYFPGEEKLGIAQAKKIKDYFSTKPYSAKGKAVIIEDGSTFTPDAQNALLKTLEELPKEAIFLIGAPSDKNFLPTVLSRCQIINLGSEKYNSYKQSLKDKSFKNYNNYIEDLEYLLKANIEERFAYIEKLKDKEEFLKALITYFRQQLHSHMSSGKVNFIKELLQAEQWAAQNVNMRAILEYLMLVMPKAV